MQQLAPTASLMIYSSAFSPCRTQRHALCLEVVAATTSHRSYIQQLHWLPVRQRVEFKLTLLAQKAIHALLPRTYLASDYQLVTAAGRSSSPLFRRSYADDHANVYAIWRPLLPVCSSAAIERLAPSLQQPDVSYRQFTRQLRSRLFCWDCDVLRLLYISRRDHILLTYFTFSSVVVFKKILKIIWVHCNLVVWHVYYYYI